MNGRTVAVVLAFACVPANAGAADGPRVADAAAAARPLLVRGQVLSTAGGVLVFTTGAAIRMAAGVAIPPGTTIGSYVRAVVDRAAHRVIAIEREPRTNVTGEIDVADLPRDEAAFVPPSAPPAPAGPTIGSVASGPVTIVIDVRVPANTPAADDVYVATDRSDYSPAEIRMQRVGARDFTATISLNGNAKLHYVFTRGTNATVERDRAGGIAVPRTAIAAPGVETHDAVVRWADIA